MFGRYALGVYVHKSLGSSKIIHSQWFQPFGCLYYYFFVESEYTFTQSQKLIAICTEMISKIYLKVLPLLRYVFSWTQIND